METRTALVSAPGAIGVETRELSSPGEGEVVVRVAECGLCGSDLKLFSGGHPKLQPPLRLGHEFHGTVEAVGDGADGVEAGQRVSVFPPIGCGECHNCRRGEPHICAQMTFVGGEHPGGLSDLVTVPAANALPLDDGVPADRRVFVEPMAVGVHAARRGTVDAGEEVVVIGAGPIGLFTALALRQQGVERIVITDLEPSRLELARRLDAGDTVLGDDLRAAIRPDGADVAFDCVGGQATATQALGLTRNGGRAVLVGITPRELQVDGVVLQRGERALIGVQMYTRDDFAIAMQMLAAGALPAGEELTRRFALDDVATAFAELDAGRRDVLKLVVAP
jgi:2-desacetyl-2-hydroxyethyl bacteriochlorophyllide A dehydrogenase